MVNMYAGMSGQGKTLYLRRLQQEYMQNKVSYISNLEEDVSYRGINDLRASIITSEEAFVNVFDYSEVIAINNYIASVSKDDPLSKEYTFLLTLMARNGDVLILDTPDVLLSSWDIVSFINMLNRLGSTYTDVHIVTLNQRLLGAADQLFWVENYNVTKISKDEIYERIGTL